MIGFAVMVAWLVLLLAWGGFWRADQRMTAHLAPAAWPSVVAVIPARDEIATIGRVVQSLTATDYPGAVKVIVVDDNSADGTGAAAQAAGADVVQAPPLPAGWSGKLWVVENGLVHVERVMSPGPDWVLLTDADIAHAPDTLRALVSKGEADGLSLVSLMARLDSRGLWGGLLIPAFIFFFQKLYPFPWVNRPGHWMAAAAGGCMLIRRQALAEIGGIALLKDALIDDCTLDARIKHGPPKRRIWLGLANTEVVSLRDNRAFGSIWTMVARTAFTQLRHSVWLLAGSVLGMVFLYLGPWIVVIWGAMTGDLVSAGLGCIAAGMMSVAYWPTLKLYGFRPQHTLLLPIAAVVYTAMTVGSALRHWQGRGGHWKGRTYP